MTTLSCFLSATALQDTISRIKYNKRCVILWRATQIYTNFLLATSFAKGLSVGQKAKYYGVKKKFCYKLGGFRKLIAGI